MTRLVTGARPGRRPRMSRGQQNVLVVVGILVVLLAANRAVNGPAPATPTAPASDVVAPVVGGRVTSGFGSRWGKTHYGVDVAAPIGTPIQAVSDGTVIEAGPASGFGLWLRLRHTDGTVTVYGHINRALAKVGQKVKAGDEIAEVGNRGKSTGPHLHLEIWPQGRRDLRVDPAVWFKRHKAQLIGGSAR